MAQFWASYLSGRQHSRAAIIEIGKQMKCSPQRAQTVGGFDDLQPGFVVRL
jgi:hypothetical protein